MRPRDSSRRERAAGRAGLVVVRARGARADAAARRDSRRQPRSSRPSPPTRRRGRRSTTPSSCRSRGYSRCRRARASSSCSPTGTTSARRARSAEAIAAARPRRRDRVRDRGRRREPTPAPWQHSRRATGGRVFDAADTARPRRRRTGRSAVSSSAPGSSRTSRRPGRATGSRWRYTRRVPRRRRRCGFPDEARPLWPLPERSRGQPDHGRSRRRCWPRCCSPAPPPPDAVVGARPSSAACSSRTSRSATSPSGTSSPRPRFESLLAWTERSLSDLPGSERLARVAGALGPRAARRPRPLSRRASPPSSSASSARSSGAPPALALLLMLVGLVAPFVVLKIVASSADAGVRPPAAGRPRHDRLDAPRRPRPPDRPAGDRRRRRGARLRGVRAASSARSGSAGRSTRRSPRCASGSARATSSTSQPP